MKKILFFVISLISPFVWADTFDSTQPPVEIVEANGANSSYPYRIIYDIGTLSGGAVATHSLVNLGGASGQMLTLQNNGRMLWQTPAAITYPLPFANGGTALSSWTQYLIPYAATTTSIGQIAIGTSGQVLTSNGAGSAPSFQAASGGGLTWTEVTGTSQTAAVNNGYISSNAALVTITLPSTAAVGSVVRVAGKGAGGFRVAQNASQVIHFLGVNTTTGVNGYLQSVTQYDAVEILCITANTDWIVLSVSGNLTYV